MSISLYSVQEHFGVRVNSRHKAIYFEVDIRVLAMTLLLLALEPYRSLMSSRIVATAWYE